MKYKGQELTEFKSDKPVFFDPPKQMFVWDRDDDGCISDPVPVYAYIPTRKRGCVIAERCTWDRCAEIPAEPKPRRATNLELMKWLAKGNGYCTAVYARFWFNYEVSAEIADHPCDENIKIRKWEDAEWHEPTAKYMGLEE